MPKIDDKELLFTPPENIQKMLKGGLNVLYPDYHLFKRDSILEHELQIRYKTIGLLEIVNDFYHLGIHEGLPLFNCQKFAGVYLDGMKNAFEHGPKDSSMIIYGLFLGDNAICHGFQDFGNYFKSAETKKKWESGEFINSTKINPDGPYNVGTTRIIRPLSDYLEIDNNQGVLFCVQTLEGLELKPSERFFEFMKK